MASRVRQEGLRDIFYYLHGPGDATMTQPSRPARVEGNVISLVRPWTTTAADAMAMLAKYVDVGAPPGRRSRLLP
ncbi:hypothetical protein WJ59_23280 [Burkholderia gladioli]|nr:hypothetical protein WJ59_23280 [Burkholderia gladioli]